MAFETDGHVEVCAEVLTGQLDPDDSISLLMNAVPEGGTAGE